MLSKQALANESAPRRRSVPPLPQTHRHDALQAIRALGPLAMTPVATGALAYFGQWLGWPDWLVDGTPFAGTSSALPPRIHLADDLLITANLLGRTDALTLVRTMIEHNRPAVSAAGALMFYHAPDLGTAIEALARSMAMNSPHLTITCVADDVGYRLEVAADVPLGALLDVIAMVGIAIHYQLVESFGSDLASLVRIETTAPDTPEAKALRPYFRCPIHFGGTRNVMTIPAHLASLANPGYDAALWALAQERLRSPPQVAHGALDLERIRRRVADLLTSTRRVPRLKQIATDEGVSSRTVARMLADAGLTFHRIVEDERRARAAVLIDDPARSLSSIASDLGFTDMSTFNRTFRRWFGDTPGRLRRLRSGRAAG